MPGNEKIRTYAGATAIVTGSASGIGKALVVELARQGCEVVLADLQLEPAEKTATELCHSGGRARAVKIDVSDYSQLAQLVNETAKRTGRLDYMFNNAGITITGSTRCYCLDDWHKIINTNLWGAINGTQAAYQVMLQQGFGHIVNTASMAGLQPHAMSVGYATTKHAIVGLSYSLRIEAAPRGIHVSVLCPGVISTPMLAGGKYGIHVAGVSAEHNEQNKIFWEKFFPMQPEVFAKKVLRAVAKNKAIIIQPAWWAMVWRLYRFFPDLATKLLTKSYEGMQKQIVCAIKKKTGFDG